MENELIIHYYDMMMSKNEGTVKPQQHLFPRDTFQLVAKCNPLSYEIWTQHFNNQLFGYALHKLTSPALL